ncbi:MAG TPA: helix-turn-helix domain-containing protein [Candidatus Eisenbacteria bacterium]
MTTKKTTRKKRATSNAVEILHRRYVAGRPKQEAALEEVRLNAAIAQQIYDLRSKAGLTQKQLANLVGTTHSVISRLEDADYDGHSLSMLQRISSALRYRLQVRFVPAGARRRIPA